MISNLIRDNIRKLTPYSSARDEFEGNASIWLDANESPTVLKGLPPEINRYPDPLQRDLRQQISSVKNIEENQIFIGNGSDEAVDLLFRIFCNPSQDKAMIFPPTYGMYGVCAAVNDIEVVESNLDCNFKINLNDFREKNRAKPKLTFICNPNNPTGNTQNAETIRQIIETSEGIVVVDEAYIDFCPENSVVSWINRYPNLVVLQTLSKAWGLAGARVGMAFSSPEIIAVMNRVKFPYNLGSPSIEIAERALQLGSLMKNGVENVISNREFLTKKLCEIKGVVKVFPSDANFLLVKFKDSQQVYNYLANNGIVVRDRSNHPGCEGCLRITVGTKGEVDKIITCLNEM